ncbi:hypothetical protein Hanom_Chr07g00651601 [Helianthus anomalus]
MKRIWAMWHVMVEPIADMACYGGTFRWEALSILHSILDMGSVFILGQNMDLGHPSLESLILIHLLSQASIFSTNPRN